ncbi:Phage integrase family protein [Candidatus Pantoea symbiotica]|jgi:integrase|uniref:Phage integrase family protein n=1 Tax=Candidatus Pantoea symbiotica TaxID=1884370 RepID=A0A1I3XJK8_9GAMM|nr:MULTISPECIES: site-specific integrase [Pantoea]KAJ9434351.1 site-specific integrase [Pantoea sp. YR343]SFK19777.1 Phage integrase family protein [Pantoea symbiotica]SFU80247.1 Phage integrase family protein [Pantoea sp. YR525]
MSHRYNLYRRASGIYVVRISVPQRFRRYAGQCEIHTSTSTYHLQEAKQRATRLIAVWHQTLREYEELDYQTLKDCAPLLTGKGMISLTNFSQAIKLPITQLIQAVINRRFPVFWLASGQTGFYVENASDVEKDHVVGGFVLNSAFEIGEEISAKGYLQPFNPLHTLRCLITEGISDEETAFRAGGENPKGGWFFDLPGVVITPDSLMINNVQAESLRSDWLASSHPVAALKAHSAPAAISAAVTTSTNEYVHHKYYSKTVTWLCEEYLNHRRKGKITVAAVNDTKKFFSFMIELMGDVTLDTVDRDFLRAFESKLRTIPANRDKAKIKYGLNGINELIAKAAENEDPLMSDESVRKYVNGVFGAIKWAVADGKFIKSPCDNFFPKKDAELMPQELAETFSSEDITNIFSLPWFISGTGERNSKGRFHQYRPFHYWMPLLGLFTGARVNEIAQLYLKDLLEEDGVFYLNLDSDEASGKKLKNANARRKIPLHSVIINLGFIDYVQALRDSGYERLFPELKAHRTKGFGRPVSAWFNESLLAGRLKMARNRSKSFHSFRHTVATHLKEKGVSSEFRKQLLGHVRGETETEVRYSKDLKPVHMIAVIEQLDFELPNICKFNSEDGLSAINNAILIKR